jgi:hypothetical protein
MERVDVYPTEEVIPLERDSCVQGTLPGCKPEPQSSRGDAATSGQIPEASRRGQTPHPRGGAGLRTAGRGWGRTSQGAPDREEPEAGGKRSEGIQGDGATLRGFDPGGQPWAH